MLILAIGANAFNSTNSSVNAINPMNVGDQAPEIAMENPDGKVMKLSSLKGKIVLIDFWA